MKNYMQMYVYGIKDSDSQRFADEKRSFLPHKNFWPSTIMATILLDSNR